MSEKWNVLKDLAVERDSRAVYVLALVPYERNDF